MYRILLFIVLPLTEMALLIWAAQEIGLLATLALVIATGVVGAILVKRQGMAVWVSARRRMAEGAFPSRELAHGAMLVVAGAFLLTPGFITDITGLLLLAPAVRERLRRWFRDRFGRRVMGDVTRVDVWR